MPTINNFELALIAEHGGSRSFEKRIFGGFQTTGLMGTTVNLAFEASRYAYVGSPLALQLWVCDDHASPMWEPYVDLTKNVRPNSCMPDEIIVKTYEENAHLRQALLNLGYFEDTEKRIQAGFATLEVWRLTEKFVEAFSAVHPAHEIA